MALVITSYIGARIGHTHPARTVLRAVAIGVTTLVLALVVGQAFD
jgi:VIT1/CCC1 family predicted Fe2+/Mn2+ transporter